MIVLCLKLKRGCIWTDLDIVVEGCGCEFGNLALKVTTELPGRSERKL